MQTQESIINQTRTILSETMSTDSPCATFGCPRLAGRDTAGAVPRNEGFTGAPSIAARRLASRTDKSKIDERMTAPNLRPLAAARAILGHPASGARLALDAESGHTGATEIVRVNPRISKPCFQLTVLHIFSSFDFAAIAQKSIKPSRCFRSKLSTKIRLAYSLLQRLSEIIVRPAWLPTNKSRKNRHSSKHSF